MLQVFIQLTYFYSTSHSELHHILRILGRRFALTPTAYKYLDIGISIGPVSSVEILLGDNKDNKEQSDYIASCNVGDIYRAASESLFPLFVTFFLRGHF